MGTDGHWRPTKLGVQHFKDHQDECVVGYRVRLARAVGDGKKTPRVEWVIDKETIDDTWHPDQ